LEQGSTGVVFLGMLYTGGAGDASSSGSGNDDHFKFMGLRIYKDDLVTIGLAVAISYGIR
jgi:hypothetical protein